MVSQQVLVSFQFLLPKPPTMLITMYCHHFQTYFLLEAAESGGCCGDVDFKKGVWVFSIVRAFGKDLELFYGMILPEH